MKIERPFGYVEILKKDNDTEISLVVINPREEAKLHFHKKTKEVAIIIEGELLVNGVIKKQFDVLVHEVEKTHGYINKTDKEVKLIYICTPPLEDADIFEV